ncbi:NAD(P)H-hydrate dehydratase [Treponema sp. OMZ 305]|uniref:NAD(P)H-hydrate dehydratase n=1 Tax=Treponema sp. OMZ 305 TaxID=1659192 RepID=UPI0020A2902C|nr:NAD(P)H-hydrate dehydratase [Treponema sp. OMZ 305]UTC57004.1 NAD(P)H-hydrate dehydratase [Treponema sp. OMZ 305]
MEKIFDSVRELDKRAEDAFSLKNGVLMENAARGMAERIRSVLSPWLSYLQHIQGDAGAEPIWNLRYPHRALSTPQSVLPHPQVEPPLVQVVCGSGDNGGDGFALARMLADFCTVRVISVKEPKSPLCKLQRERLRLLGIPVAAELQERCDVLVDALFGTGIRGSLDSEMCAAIDRMNAVHGYKVACDIPSGLNEFGIPSTVAFRADETCTMGALKTALYADAAKDYTGVIHVCNLGLPRRCYEGQTDTFLLSVEDMKLPHRAVQNTHKMSYGHGVFFCGEKTGACMLAASAALHFGIGLVTVFGAPMPAAPFDFMYAAELPENFSAAMIGSGLGRSSDAQARALDFLSQEHVREHPLILDADILHNPKLPELLPLLKTPILTPHPKEFQSLLANSGLAQVSVAEIQDHRFEYLRLFCGAFPQAVIVLKGAYPLIGCGSRVFVNSLGSNALAKAGTGDVLSGMITALAAQGYSPVEAAYTASLAHAEAAKLLHTSDYGLTASALAEAAGRFGC